MVQDLVDQRIVVECQSPSFLSSLFLRPKPKGKSRLIMNLSLLNKFLLKEHLKMENLQTALEMLEQGQFMCKIYLKNAYSIPIDPEHQPYLAFRWFETLLRPKTGPSNIHKSDETGADVHEVHGGQNSRLYRGVLQEFNSFFLYIESMFIYMNCSYKVYIHVQCSQ